MYINNFLKHNNKLFNKHLKKFILFYFIMFFLYNVYKLKFYLNTSMNEKQL